MWTAIRSGASRPPEGVGGSISGSFALRVPCKIWGESDFPFDFPQRLLVDFIKSLVIPGVLSYWECRERALQRYEGAAFENHGVFVEDQADEALQEEWDLLKGTYKLPESESRFVTLQSLGPFPECHRTGRAVQGDNGEDDDGCPPYPLASVLTALTGNGLIIASMQVRRSGASSPALASMSLAFFLVVSRPRSRTMFPPTPRSPSTRGPLRHVRPWIRELSPALALFLDCQVDSAPFPSYSLVVETAVDLNPFLADPTQLTRRIDPAVLPSNAEPFEYSAGNGFSELDSWMEASSSPESLLCQDPQTYGASTNDNQMIWDSLLLSSTGNATTQRFGL